MEIGDWKATRGLNEAYRAIRSMGLESNVAELDAFGFTVIEGAASSELVGRLKKAISFEVERKTGISPRRRRWQGDRSGHALSQPLAGKGQGFR